MKDEGKTKEQLIKELEASRHEREHLEEQLRALKRAVEGMQLGVTITDTEGKILYTNPAEARMHGYSVEELIGKDVRVLAPEGAGRPMTLEEMKEIKSWTREGLNIRKDRSIFPVQLMSDVVTDRDGAPVGIVTTCEDITLRKKEEEELRRYREDLKRLVEERTRETAETAERLLQEVAERKRVENLIRESEERYKNLVELATDIIYISDRNGNQVFMNSAAFKILEYSPEEVINRPFINLIHPDDREKTLRKRKEMSEKGIDVFGFENRYLTKSGKTINVLHNVRVLRDEKGEFAGTQGIARDITELKRAEAKLKLFSRAFEEAMDGIQIVDLNGHILYSNRAVEEIYGFSSDELAGKHVNEMNEDKEFAEKVILPSIRRTGRWNGELIVIHKDGRRFPIWLSTSLVRDAKGEPVAMVGTIRDITERRQIAEERENLIVELRDALSKIKTLSGLLPICASCKKVRDDKGYWQQIEAFIGKHTEAEFSHSICPECRERLYPGF